MHRLRNIFLFILMSSFILSCGSEPKEDTKTAENQVTQKSKKANKKKSKREKVPAKLNAPEAQRAATQAPSLPDTYPLYPGCKEQAYEARKRCANQKMVENVIKVMKYPQSAIDNNVNGTVVYTFIIEADGTMSDLRLEKSLTPACDEAGRLAIEDLMRLSGPWEPGTLDGENQPVRYTLPLSFQNSPKDKG